MDQPIRVAIVDDHPGVRAGIRNLLANADDIIVVGEGADGLEAIQLVAREKPDILLLDVEIPALRGDEVVQRLRKVAPEVKVLAVSSYNDDLHVQGMLENGADGYITKDEAPHLLMEAVHSIMRDAVKWVSPQVKNQIPHFILDEKTFTGRELDILRYISLGKDDEEIARALHINHHLLTRYLELLMAKFNVQSRADFKRSAQQLLSTAD